MTHTGYKKITIVLIVLMFGVFFNTIAYAQGLSTAPTESMTDFAFNMLGSLLNLLYLITLPILIVAGKAMDNSMIYGEFINLDKPLFMLRNLSRTFANFAVGGVILRNIIQYIFTDWDGKEPKFVKELIIKSVGMILAINFSRFAIGALVDLSTIATYSLGAMPLSILKETGNKDMPILEVASYIDYQSKKDSNDQSPLIKIPGHTYYKRGNINIPRCSYYKSIITGPEYFPSIPNKPEISFNNFGAGRQYCALTTQNLADITDLEAWKDANLQTGNLKAINVDNRKEYITQIIDQISQTGDCKELSLSGGADIIGQNMGKQMNLKIGTDKIKDIKNKLTISDGQVGSIKTCGGNITGNAYQNSDRKASFMKEGGTPYSQEDGLTVNTLINKSKGMVGPFIMLYMNLLDFSNLSASDTANQTVNTTIGGITEFTLKAIISIALIIPLIALAVVLIVRIVILRGIIAFIPLGIVVAFLGKEMGMGEGKGLSLGAQLGEVNAKSIIGLIFAPVLPVFTISISIIILQTLQISMKDAIDTDNKTWDFFGIEFSTDSNNTSSMDFWGMQSIELDKGDSLDGGSGFANFLPWLFLNLFAIGLMWTMVKMSFEGSKITGAIGGKIMETGGNLLGSIQIPGTGGLGMKALGSAPTKIMDTANAKINQITNQQNTEIDNKITKLLGNETPEQKTDETKKKKSADFINGLSGVSTPDFESYKKLAASGIEKHATSPTEGKVERDKFDKSSSINQASVISGFVEDLLRERNKLDPKTKTTERETMDRQLSDIAEKTIEGGYSDFKETDNKIKADKLKEFVTYLNQSTLFDKMKDGENKKKEIAGNFSNQIKYTNGTFQETIKKN